MKKHHAIVLYASNQSHLSDLTREYFRQNGFDFEEVNIDKDKSAADDVFRRTGKREGPVVEIDGRTVIGYKPEIFIILLNDRDAAAGSEQ